MGFGSGSVPCGETCVNFVAGVSRGDCPLTLDGELSGTAMVGPLYAMVRVRVRLEAQVRGR